jgi:hypothetical protein
MAEAVAKEKAASAKERAALAKNPVSRVSKPSPGDVPTGDSLKVRVHNQHHFGNLFHLIASRGQ